MAPTPGEDVQVLGYEPDQRGFLFRCAFPPACTAARAAGPFRSLVGTLSWYCRYPLQRTCRRSRAHERRTHGRHVHGAHHLFPRTTATLHPMTVRLAHPIALICAFTWLGFVCAISFMEAWLKFQAHGVTLPIGLGIGRLVFHALNKVEWVLAIAILVDVLWKRRIDRHVLFILVPVILLV